MTAEYIRSKGRTDVEVVKPAPARKVQRPGLALLRLTTARGGLTVEY